MVNQSAAPIPPPAAADEIDATAGAALWSTMVDPLRTPERHPVALSARHAPIWPRRAPPLARSAHPEALHAARHTHHGQRGTVDGRHEAMVPTLLAAVALRCCALCLVRLQIAFRI